MEYLAPLMCDFVKMYFTFSIEACKIGLWYECNDVQHQIHSHCDLEGETAWKRRKESGLKI